MSTPAMLVRTTWFLNGRLWIESANKNKGEHGDKDVPRKQVEHSSNSFPTIKWLVGFIDGWSILFEKI